MVDLARCARTLPAVLALFLAADGVGQVAPPPQSTPAAHRPVPHQAGSRPATGQLRAVAQWYHGQREDCVYGDAMTLLVLDGQREVASHRYCSTQGIGHARMITDTRGVRYVLLEHAEGHGTHATSYYLTVFEFDDFLTERARFLIDDPIVDGQSVYDFNVAAPPGGGIRLSGQWRVEGPAVRPPPRRRSVYEFDTAGPL
jgi:hypothetical protein